MKKALLILIVYLATVALYPLDMGMHMTMSTSGEAPTHEAYNVTDGGGEAYRVTDGAGEDYNVYP